MFFRFINMKKGLKYFTVSSISSGPGTAGRPLGVRPVRGACRRQRGGLGTLNCFTVTSHTCVLYVLMILAQVFFFFSALFLYVHLSWCCKTRPRGTDQSEGEESSKGCMEGAWSAARTEAWLAGWTLTLLCWLRLRVVPLALTRYLNGSSRFIKPELSSYRCKDESRK